MCMSIGNVKVVNDFVREKEPRATGSLLRFSIEAKLRGAIERDYRSGQMKKKITAQSLEEWYKRRISYPGLFEAVADTSDNAILQIFAIMLYPRKLKKRSDLTEHFNCFKERFSQERGDIREHVRKIANDAGMEPEADLLLGQVDQTFLWTCPESLLKKMLVNTMKWGIYVKETRYPGTVPEDIFTEQYMCLYDYLIWRLTKMFKNQYGVDVEGLCSDVIYEIINPELRSLFSTYKFGVNLNTWANNYLRIDYKEILETGPRIPQNKFTRILDRNCLGAGLEAVTKSADNEQGREYNPWDKAAPDKQAVDHKPEIHSFPLRIILEIIELVVLSVNVPGKIPPEQFRGFTRELLKSYCLPELLGLKEKMPTKLLDIAEKKIPGVKQNDLNNWSPLYKECFRLFLRVRLYYFSKSEDAIIEIMKKMESGQLVMEARGKKLLLVLPALSKAFFRYKLNLDCSFVSDCGGSLLWIWVIYAIFKNKESWNHDQVITHLNSKYWLKNAQISRQLIKDVRRMLKAKGSMLHTIRKSLPSSTDIQIPLEQKKNNLSEIIELWVELLFDEKWQNEFNKLFKALNSECRHWAWTLFYFRYVEGFSPEEVLNTLGNGITRQERDAINLGFNKTSKI